MMKKFTLLMTLSLMTFIVFGQSMMEKRTKDFIKSKGNVEQISQQTKDLTIIWQNDFSTPSEWVTDYDSDNANDGPWVIGTDGPAGYYSEAMGAIESTTAANGFAMYDSDATGIEVGSQDTKLIYYTSIDCAAYDAVAVSFESYYERFHGSCYVEVSVDSTIWTQYAVHEDVEVNAFSANPELVTVNISEAAANQATVYFRLRYIGEWDYAWMVDDIQFFVAPDHDLKLADARVDFYQFPQFSDPTTYSMGEYFGYSGFYGQIPKRQISSVNAEIVFSGVVKNLGTIEATPTIAITVTDPSNTEIFSNEASSVAALATEVNDTIGIIDNVFTIPDPVLGIYTWSFEAFETDTVEENPADNAIVYETEITENLYARHTGNITGSWSTDNFTGGGADGDIIGVVYPFFNPDTIVKVNVYISSMTGLNTSFVVKLMSRDDTDEWVEFNSSAIIMINDSSDIGTLHEISFPDVVPIDPIEGFTNVLVAVEYYPAGETFRVGMDGTVPTSGHETYMYMTSDATWYYYGGEAVPIIDLILDTDTGIDELNEFSNFNLYPNPTTGIITVENVEHATIEVFNLLGNCVAVVNNAEFNTNLDLSAFAEGTYVVRVTADQGVGVRKVNLVK